MAIVSEHTQPTVISSDEIKRALRRYFYEKRKYIYFATEMMDSHNYRADFIALQEYYVNMEKVDEVMEVEIKVSWADFIRDFKAKKLKHDNYSGATSGTPRVNKFAFCVPAELADKCNEFLSKNYPKYGLFIYHTDGTIYCGKPSPFSPKKLLTKAMSPISKTAIVKQMAINITYF